MADINAWLEKVEKRASEYDLVSDKAKIAVSKDEITLLCARLRAALRVVEAAARLQFEATEPGLYKIDMESLKDLGRSFAAFQALCEKEERDG